MLAPQIARDFINDMRRMPLLFQLALMYMAGAAGWQWWKRRQFAETLAASEAWPVYRARMVWAQVLDRQGGGEDGPSYWEGLLTYSYTVPGQELEVGEYRKRFELEENADAWARALRDTFVDVRVDPANAKRSIWHEGFPSSLPSIVVDASHPSHEIEPEPWGIREAAVAVVFFVSASGALIASGIQLSSVLGRPIMTASGNTPAFFGMHIGAMVCAVTSGLLFGQSGQKGSGRRLREAFVGTSANNRIVKVLGTYYGVVFAYGWVRIAAGDDPRGGAVVLMFSAGWLLFYMTAAQTCWQTMHNRR